MSIESWSEIEKQTAANQGLISIMSTFESEKDYWLDFINGDDPYRLKCPDSVEINQIQKLTFIKILCKDKLISGVISFIKEILGDSFLDSV